MIAQAAGKSVLPDRCEGSGACVSVFFFQAEDGIRDYKVTGVQTCALPIWFDEEPPPEIYSEGLTRTNATGGIVTLTFTPLQGMSEVVRRFLHEPSPDRHVTDRESVG